MPNDNGGIMNSRNIAGDVVYTASARTVFNFRGSFTSLEDDYSAPEYAVGEEGLSSFWPNNPWYKPYVDDIPLIYYPLIQINGLGAGNFTFGKSSYWYQHPRHYSFSGKMSQARGSHYLKAGAEYRYHVGDGTYPNLMNFVFVPDTTANSFIRPDIGTSGNAWASFLLGAMNPASSNANKIPYQSIQIPFMGLFVHDDWKITRNITLNLGLRYEWESGPYDRRDQYSRFLDLTVPNPQMQQNPPAIPADLVAMSRPTFNGAWIFSDEENRKAWVTQKSIFLPRVGLAVRVNDRTAVNIGYARYVVPISTIAGSLARTNYFSGFSATSTPLPMVEGRPQAFLADPFPSATNPVQPVVGKGFGQYTNVGNAVSFPDQDYRAQTNDRINFTIMREIPGAFKLDGTWFMNFGRHVPHDEQFNMADPNLSYTYKAQLSTNVANPFYNYGTRETFPGALRNQATVTRGSLLRPYPHYGNIAVNQFGNWRSRYQALQLRAQRSYSAGATLLVAYNYNQERNEAYFNDIQQYVQQTFWLGSNNARHRLTLAGTYDFPIGKGRKLGSDLHPVLNAAFGGWQISGIYTYRSGEYLRFGAMDVVGEPVIDNPGPGKWFNQDAFKILTPFTPRYNPFQYPDITGPIFWNMDGTLSKTFPIKEKYNLEFRFEAYNLTNSLMWANPNMTIGNAQFGRSAAQATTNRGREMQYTLRFIF
jgi:hypothetical protein